MWVKSDNTVIKLTSFADDVTFLVKDVQSLKRIVKLMKGFKLFSSLKMNAEKCEACWIGHSKANQTSQSIVAGSHLRVTQLRSYVVILTMIEC